MTEKQAITGFAITLSGLLALITFFFFEIDKTYWLLEEGGIIESASAFGYLLCAAFVVYQGKLAYLKQYYYLFLLDIAFMLRELDFDKRFTTMGILKTKFFVSNNVPLTEKIIGGVIVTFLLYIVIITLFRHSKDFFRGLREESVISFGALIVCIFIVLSKVFDGLDRKLKGFGLDMSETFSMRATIIEEIVELGIPIIMMLTFSAYFKQYKVNKI